MKQWKKSAKLFASSMILSLLMAVLPGISSIKFANAAAGTTLYFNPSSASLSTSSTTTLTARINTTNNITEVDMVITYDQTRFSLASADVSCSTTFGTTPIATVIPSPENGTASVACGILSGDPVTGDNIDVATFVFHSLTTAVSNSAVSFTSSSLATDNVEVGDMLIGGAGTGATLTITAPAAASSSSSSHHHSKKKSTTKKYTITQSKNSVKRGMVLVQRGKKFTKKSPVLIYFSKPGGGYYSPTKIITNSSGGFIMNYKVNKPVGKYSWYAVDSKTGKKSKVKTYTVK